jgi:sulfate permease, SulP family
MAYARIAGLSPVAGLYGLLLPVAAYVIFGSSRQLIVGPEGALAIMVATAVAPLAGGDPVLYAELAAMLALLTGARCLVAWVARMGWIADYLSRAVLVGYIHGIAVVLICGQLGKLFGVDISASDPLPQMKEFLSELGSISGLTVVVSCVSIGVLVLCRARFRRSRPHWWSSSSGSQRRMHGI